MMGLWGVMGCGALAGHLLASVSATVGSMHTDFQASLKYLGQKGQKGSLVCEESVGDEHWVEDASGVASTVGVGYWGGARG